MKKILFILLIASSFLAAADSEETKRPQEPKVPYPYNEEQVSFENSADGVKLAGTLTWPRSEGPFPTVVLLHGSAPLDRDSSMFGHKPFLVLADHLTRQGIAVLRFDKRSAGKSTGDYNTANLEDFARDALAGVEYLKTRKEIDLNQIGLIGHSEGGMTAALASTRSKDIAFMVLMASPCTNWEELISVQEAALQRADGVSEEMIKQSRKFRKEMFAILKKEKNRELAENRLREYFSQLTPEQKKLAESYYGPEEGQIQFFNSVGFRYVLTYDPTVPLKTVKIPVLALNGELDFVVSPALNLSRIAKALEENEDLTILELPKLNHGFQTCQTGSMMEAAKIEETLSPTALNAVSEWILKRV